MSKQQQSKKQVPQKKNNLTEPSRNKSSFKLSNRNSYIILFLFTFIVYGNSIMNNYALDDLVVDNGNEFVQKGISGIKDIITNDAFTGYLKKSTNNIVAGGRYRPLSLVTFAIEYQFVGLSPHFSHFINILLFAICAIGIFIFIRKVFEHSQLKLFATSAIPLLATLIFIVHPIHTEVIANIKSRDEIMCMLFSIFSTISFLNYIDNGRKIKDLIIGFVLIFLGVLSKENAFMFIVIVPMTLFFFRKASLKDYVMVTLPLIIAGGIFVFLRSKFASGSVNSEITDLLNNPLSGATSVQKFATIVYTIGKYFLLLVIPYPLSCFYDYNTIPLKSFADMSVVVSFMAILIIGVIAIIQFKKKTLVSYSIFFFATTFALVSNILFPIGTAMSERFVFIPSLGFCLIVAYYINKLANPPSRKQKTDNIQFDSVIKNKTSLFIIIAILGTYSIMSIKRNMDWKDNTTLFAADIKTSPGSVNLNKGYGYALVDSATVIKDKQHQLDSFNMAKPYLKKIIELYPKYAEIYTKLGFIYYMTNNFDSATYYYRTGLNYAPDSYILNYNLGKSLNKLKRYDEAIKYLNDAVKSGADDGPYFNLALAYTNKGDPDQGLKYFAKVIELNPKRGDAFYYSGLIYKAKGDTVKAKEFLDKSNALGGVNASSN